jgi:hypothetical protein
MTELMLLFYAYLHSLLMPRWNIGLNVLRKAALTIRCMVNFEAISFFHKIILL